uniref:Candidate secreted effector n=1 Tax=Meloidogyne incognita TaxID=6306 RepID=A0A914MGS2_MELIC
MVKILFLIFIALFILDGMIKPKNQKGVLAQNKDDDGGFWSEVSFRKKRKANKNKKNAKKSNEKCIEASTIYYKDYNAY